MNNKFKKISSYLSKYDFLSNVIALVILIFTFSLFNKDFFKINNMVDIVRAFSFIGVAAIGQTIVMISGGIDLSVGGIAGVSAITAGYLMDKVSMHPYLILLIGLLVGVLCGFINALLINKLKIVPFVATLGTLEIFSGFVMVITKGYPIFTIPKEVQNVVNIYVLGIPFPVILLILVAVTGHLLLKYLNIGRYIYAIGGNIEASLMSGISITKVRYFAYMMSGLFSGIGGILALSWLGSGQPTIGQDWLMTVVAAVIIGGTSLSGGEGNITGTITGILLLGVLENGLTMMGVSPFWRGAVTGIVLILAVLMDVTRKKRLKRKFSKKSQVIAL